MTDDIRPALSAEEWAGELKDREPDGVAHWPLVDYNRHALAALCLYQQPFGFIPFHVALLDTVADTLDNIREDERAEELRYLRARIAALLPPEAAK